jgi:voltage-gated potassium channel
MEKETPAQASWRSRLFTIIFESDTPAGKAFDVALLSLILLSLVVVMLQSIPYMNAQYGKVLNIMEWIITILFTIEYVLRLICVKKPVRYAASFYGVIDLISIIPTYVSLLFPGTKYLLVIRALRLMRVFRIFKLTNFVREARAIRLAMRASSGRILVFLVFVLVLSIILGSVVYVVEAPYNEKFSTIPQSIYWCIVTITTVGYGDISPVTPLGKFTASLIMILGYAIIAVPTGIVTVELSKTDRHQSIANQACPNCSKGGHDVDARFCRFCGHALES